MSNLATTPPVSDSTAATRPDAQVLGVINADIGPVYVTLMHDDDGSMFFNLGFETGGEFVDFGLNPAAAYGFAALICDVSVTTTPAADQDRR